MNRQGKMLACSFLFFVYHLILLQFHRRFDESPGKWKFLP